MINLYDGIVWYTVFLLSTTFHEAAHAFSAMKMGDLTAYNAGQVSLSPIPHIRREPIGTVLVPVISFFAAGWMIGWARTPYNYEWAYTYPKKSAAMAAAGPAANFILILISAFLIHAGIFFGVFFAPESITISSLVGSNSTGLFEVLAKFLSVLFSLNLILFVFNLIPFPPLDGSGIIPMYLPDELGRRYMTFVRSSVFSLFGLLVAWKLFDLIYFKIHLVFINLLYWGSNYQ